LDLLGTVEDALQLVAAKAAEKNLELACHVEPEVPTWIIGDSVRVKQILLNLLNNAVKFTEAGEIVLALSVEAPTLEHSACLRLSVSDTGIGIPADRMNRLFKSFSQVDASTSRRYGGSGLGLVITKRLVELMGGAIAVETEEGVGTTFSFSIPLQATSPPEDELREVWLTGLRGRNALVVDDNRTNRTILERKLRAWGLEVQATGLPLEALDWTAGGAQFDVCVIDYLMPEMDGLELVRRIRQQKGPMAPPMILFSASTPSGSEFRQMVGGMGFSAVLTKPAKSRHLLKALYDAVRPGADRKTAGAAATRDAADAACRPDGAPLSILLVDDNRINQKVASKILGRLGYAPDVVSSGEEAVRACFAGRYDLVLMDIEMPDMDGIAATALIRQRLAKPDQPYIVALTANAMATERERYLRSGMDDYLSKPLDVGALIASLRAAAGFLASRGQGAWALEVEVGIG
jgi:CheY-like chemotaxis protein